MHHFVRGLHGLGVDLIGPLGHDHVDHFLDDRDIGQFEVALLQLAEAILVGVAKLRGPRGGRLAVQIPPKAVQTAGVRETRELNLKTCRAVCAGVADNSIGRDVDAGRAGWHGLKAALHDKTVARRDTAIGPGLQRAITRVRLGAVGKLHFQESVTLDRDIEAFAGVRKFAIRENLGRRHRLRAMAHLHSRRQLVAGALVGARTVELKSANEKLRAEIAKRKEIETELVQAQKMEAVGRLAGGVAHDFNNILTAIMGYSELILADATSNSTLHGNAEEIFKSAQRAAELTRRLLAFSRRQILELKVVNLGNLVNDLLKMLRHMISENVEPITINTADLWLVNVDPHQIEQVILNLAINAHDAMPKGGKLTIETANIVLQDADRAVTHEGVSPGGYVVLSVSDTGVGMTPEVQERLFEPFFTTKEFGKGTGLGLATCYGIIKQSGGHIAVSSTPGQGSTFRVYLPRVTAVDAQLARQRQAQIQPGGAETILLVEDESSLRHLATKILCNLGYNVLAAENGVEALQVIEQRREQKVNLLLTDVVMPKLGGRELADQLHAKRPDVKVLFTSGWTGDAIVHHGILDEGVAFLAKPYTPDVLARKVREVLDATA